MLHSSRTVIFGSDLCRITLCLPSTLVAKLHGSTLSSLQCLTLESIAEFEERLGLHEFQIVIVISLDRLHINCVFEDKASWIFEDLPHVDDINTYLEHLIGRQLSTIEVACAACDESQLPYPPITPAIGGQPIYDYSPDPFGIVDEEPVAPLHMNRLSSPYDAIGPLVDSWLEKSRPLPPNGKRPRE